MDSNDLGELHLVEDNQDIREYLVRALSRAGYIVHGYASAESFFSAWRASPPCVLILDMHLPRFSGVEIQKRLLKTGDAAPIIFISGQSNNDDIINAFRGGAIEFLWKPFQFEELLAAVSLAMDKSRQQVVEQKRREEMRRMMDMLSPREREILPLLVSGHSNKSIAMVTGIQPDTAKKHKANILTKLGLKDLSELICRFSQPVLPPSDPATGS